MIMRIRNLRQSSINSDPLPDPFTFIIRNSQYPEIALPFTYLGISKSGHE
jgi:hypothetical protein